MQHFSEIHLSSVWPFLGFICLEGLKVQMGKPCKFLLGWEGLGRAATLPVLLVLSLRPQVGR